MFESQHDVASDVDDDLCDFLGEFGVPTSYGAVYEAAVADDAVADDAPPPFEPKPYEFDAGEDGYVEHAAASLRHNGFCVLRSATGLIPHDVCSACAPSAAARLAVLLELARQAGHDQPRRDVLRYAEVCSRTPGGMRFDVRFPEGGVDGDAAPDQPAGLALPPCWRELREHVTRWVAPVLRRAAGVAETFDDSAGFVTSLAGAPDQHFHPDGTAAGLVNVFTPLCSVTVENGPTELRPGTHVWCESAWGNEPRWDERRQLPVAPTLGVGEILLFDYRCYHRGLANRSAAPRPVGYVVYATRRGLRDVHNFPSETLVAEAAARLAEAAGAENPPGSSKTARSNVPSVSRRPRPQRARLRSRRRSPSTLPPPRRRTPPSSKWARAP